MMINVRDMICMVTWELMKPSGDLNRILRRYSRILDLVASRTFLNNSSEEVFRLRVAQTPLDLDSILVEREKVRTCCMILEVTVEDIAKGKREEIQIPFLGLCHHCNGTGAASVQSDQMWNLRWTGANKASLQPK